MLRSRIIPVLLVRNKGLVKTIKFSNDKYVGDPLNAVRIFNEKEADELAIYDIDASVKEMILTMMQLGHGLQNAECRYAMGAA